MSKLYLTTDLDKIDKRKQQTNRFKSMLKNNGTIIVGCLVFCWLIQLNQYNNHNNNNPVQKISKLNQKKKITSNKNRKEK